jgi:histidine triad (HIT) family protein
MNNVHYCIFCRVAAGAMPAYILHQDEHSLAFMDSSPVAPGHAIVMAKPHVENIFDISVPVLQAVMATVHRVAKAVNSVFLPEGLSILQSNGPGARQTVRHFHIHVLPRSAEDGLMMNWHPEPGERHVIEEAAQRIRERM